jgi:hypothetical protein
MLAHSVKCQNISAIRLHKSSDETRLLWYARISAVINSPEPHDGSRMVCIDTDTPCNSVIIRWIHDGGVKKMPAFFFSSFVNVRVSCNDNSENEDDEDDESVIVCYVDI